MRFFILPFVLFPFRELRILIKVAAALAHSPLRRIISRTLQVFEYQRIGSHHPFSFVVIDGLECGHTFTSYEWCFRDLLFAYADPIDSPHVTARRHRCHKCRDIALAKKPVASVPVEVVAVAS